MSRKGGGAADRQPDESSEQQIEQYLRLHPDFFERHLDLLGSLHVPHPVRPAVSLVERRLALLQESNARLTRKLNELVRVARDNDCLSRRMQSLTLALIEARTLEDLLIGIQSVLRDDFNADFSAIRLAARPRSQRLAGEREFVTPHVLEPFAELLRERRPRCGPLNEGQAEGLFAETAPRVGSAALVPLEGVDWHGVLAVGSEDPDRFHPTMGSLFLSRMAEQVSLALRRYLRAPEQP